MSSKTNQKLSFWKDILAKLRCGVLTCRGETLSVEDQEKIANVKWLTLAIWTDCIPEGELSLSRNLQLIADSDIFDFCRIMSSIDEELIAHINEDISYNDFKRHMKSIEPTSGPFIGALKALIAPVLNHQYEHFKVLRTCLLFATRINVKSERLEEEALTKYLALEASLQGPATFDEREVISRWFPKTPEAYSILREGFKPKHGNGAVAEHLSPRSNDLVAKYKAFGMDSKLVYLYKQLDFPCPDFVSDVCQRRSSRLMFVPKSYKTYRSISMEPAHLMWIQEGLLEAWLRFFKESRSCPIRRRWRPDQPSRNADLAWEGSIGGSFATIDLSSASDSVTWELVKQWFRDSCLYQGILCTRSTHTELPDGTELALKKCAPMGSALNFPIEVIVFCAITECAIRDAGGTPETSRYLVYGDDIVVESEFADSVIERLQRNGFVVNTTKSFYNSNSEHYFRESCGGHYIDGIDCTPVRIPRFFEPFQYDKRHPTRIGSHVDVANELALISPLARLLVISQLKRLPTRIAVPYSSDGEKGLYSKATTNFHLERKWSEDLQCYLVRHGQLSTRRRRYADEDGEILLYEYLRHADGRERLLYPEDVIPIESAFVSQAWDSHLTSEWCLT